ncbi:MAG: rhodanese domain-containing protein [Spirochaetales bacterium]|nr:rhodanese domain-containing protein [Spirochaetales bacterium]
MEKNLLFYKFTPLIDPEMTQAWQRLLCEGNGLKGRVIVAAQGINGTISGPVERLKAYVKAMNRSRDFRNIEYKWTLGSASDYPRLSVKVRKELVTLAPDEQFDVFSPTRGLKPQEWHAYLQAHPDVTLLDARNVYESAIGVFQGPNLVTPPILAFRDIKPYLDQLPRDKPVLTYCTGDIRCEYLSAYLRHKGFQEVYHLDGGIIKYGEKYRDDGFWNGKCFVFDKRMSLAFSEKSVDMGSCGICGQATSAYVDVQTGKGEVLQLVCPACQSKAVAP